MVATASELPLEVEVSVETERQGIHPLLELVLVGGLTPLLFPLSWLLRRALGLDSAEYAVGFVFFYGAYLINDPHFAVTYFLFYRDVRGRALGDAFSRGQRLRYWLAGFVLPAALAAWSIASLAGGSAPMISALIQLMFFLVGWHYVKQGFGVLLVLAQRRGVRFTPLERSILLAHALTGWAYAWASPADPGTIVEEKGVVYTTLAHGEALERVTHWVFLATAVLLAGMLVRKRLRDKDLPIVILAPLLAFLSSIWSWTIYSSIDPLVRYMTPALHSLQYLYFVWLLRAPEAREREGPPWFERASSARLGMLAISALLLGCLLFHVGPSALDTIFHSNKLRGTALGVTPYFATLYAFVNIHHFCMDAVLWRRQNPETHYLLRV